MLEGWRLRAAPLGCASDLSLDRAWRLRREACLRRFGRKYDLL